MRSNSILTYDNKGKLSIFALLLAQGPIVGALQSRNGSEESIKIKIKSQFVKFAEILSLICVLEIAVKLSKIEKRAHTLQKSSR